MSWAHFGCEYNCQMECQARCTIKEMRETSSKADIQCIRNDESAGAVHVTTKSLVDIMKITMKRDTQTRDDDVDYWQRGRLDRLGGLVVSDRRYL
ncbi:hypothetical protein Y032_0086g1940 [Ancylostoma ceylanicum]|uniref:Uncharacterized protein n=1 Tax=Ancylostoma ceylanicum TaxID=53326 RepID=A0A016TNX0_9BILA|nr:hypothetical protein Y032_0086g1940 [Ancylostoma ceylanicum]